MPPAFSSLLFWVAAGALASLAAYLVMRFARTAEASSETGDDPARAVYQRQLAEIDDLADGGLLPDQERAAARAEAGRRLLSAKAVPDERASPAARRIVFLGAGSAALIALGLYLVFGSPGTPDQAYRTRLQAWRRSEPSALRPDEIAAVLNDTLKSRPNDVRLLTLLGNVDRSANDPVGAVAVLTRAVRLDPANADLKVALGDALEAAAGGKPSPEAEAAFRGALVLDPKNQAARYFLGGALAARGQMGEAVSLWRSLAADLPAADPRRPGLLALADQAEHPGAAPAPAEAGVSSQSGFIRAMVSSLAARLQANPDDPAGWAQLVRSYGVLGDGKAQEAALARARALFAKRPDDLKRIEAQAKR